MCSVMWVIVNYPRIRICTASQRFLSSVQTSGSWNTSRGNKEEPGFVRELWAFQPHQRQAEWFFQRGEAPAVALFSTMTRGPNSTVRLKHVKKKRKAASNANQTEDLVSKKHLQNIDSPFQRAKDSIYTDPSVTAAWLVNEKTRTNPNSYTDATSQLLFEQWKGKSGKDLLPLLKQRVKNVSLVCIFGSWFGRLCRLEFVFTSLLSSLQDEERRERLKTRMKIKLAKKGITPAKVLVDPSDKDDAEEDEDRENTSETPAEPGLSQDLTDKSADVGGHDVHRPPPAEPLQSSSDDLTPEHKPRLEIPALEPLTQDSDDDRTSVASETSSIGSRTPTRSRKRKFTDSVSELTSFGGSSPLPKRTRFASPERICSPSFVSSQKSSVRRLTSAAVFRSPARQSPFRSPVLSRRKFKKRKSTGIMGF